MNPYLLDTPAVVSFSGGRTSGYMLWHILQAFGGKLPEDVKVIFCNTGKERPETLDFVERCSQEWGVDVTWLEYRYEGKAAEPVGGHWIEKPATLYDLDDSISEQNPEGDTLIVNERPGTVQAWISDPPKKKAKGCHTFVQVDYATASRNGEPFEQVIRARNMLPNVMARFCTVELKIRTSNRFIKSLGAEWWSGYTNAIGLRADEPRRVAKLQSTNRHGREEPIAPLAKAGVTLADVMRFWGKQPFDLQLEQHEGNCDLCFLKGQGKIQRILRDRPDLADWWVRMEHEASHRGIAVNPSVAMFRKDRAPYRIQLELAQRPTLFDEHEADELSIACHCTD